MQNAPSEKRQLGAVEVSAFSLPITRSKFDVAVFAVERADSVDCFWVYSTELFDSATAANMAEMFETLLRDALTNPEMGVSLLKLVSEEQKKRIKEERLERRQSSKKKLLGVEVKAIGAESGSKE
jgi:non-ribosomal peptide synthetase component F